MEHDALAGLDGYQILTELQGDGGTRTYLARHRELNRDVAITIYTATDPFLADAERLKSLKHANVIPVIDARRLPDGTVAVVRPRVRGTTLDQLLSAVGAMPQSRIDTAMADIQSALAWARTNGIVERYVSPDSLVFQQGNGRVLLSFEPSAQPVDDQRTMRELGAAMHGGTAERTPAAAIPQDNTAVVVMQRKGMSFGARVFTAFAVIAAIVVAVVLFAKSREKPARTTAGVIADTSVSGGETVRSAPIDTMVYPTPRIVEPNQPVTPTPQPVYPMPVQPMPVQPMPVQPMPVQPMPARPTPAPVQPEPQPTRPVSPPVDTSVVSRPPTLDVCDSPTPEDQRHCVSTAVEKADQPLNSVYQKLISALRRQAAAGDSAADPSSVEELRASQRRWLEERDSVCRGAGSGLLYARDRAGCYADRAASRTRELQAQLDAIP